MNTPFGKVVALDSHKQTADRRQADYYRRLLDGLRAEVHEELARHSEALTRHQQTGDLSGVRGSHRLVRANETELRTLDYLIRALDARFAIRP